MPTFTRIRLIHKESGEIIESTDYFNIKGRDYKTMTNTSFPYELEDIITSRITCASIAVLIRILKSRTIAPATKTKSLEKRLNQFQEWKEDLNANY